MSAKVIRAHDPGWAAVYAQEAARLRQALGECVRQIDHIGGTAIAGIYTKPVIDILAQASSLADVELRTPQLVALGYEARGEYGIPDRRYFSRKGAGNVSGYHLHIYVSASASARRHLAFRDFLMLRPDIAQAYSELKRSIAGPDGILPPDYADLKSGFVQRVERQALAHFEQAARPTPTPP